MSNTVREHDSPLIKELLDEVTPELMNVTKLHMLAEDAWTPCDGCTESDKEFWIKGFITAGLRFNNYD